MTVSVIIPTVGRETLQAAVTSAAGADEVVVVIDDAKAAGWTTPPPPANMKVLHVNGGDHGYTARTAGMAAATGTHLAFLDDDDVYTPGALDVMRAAADPDRPVIFRMDHYRHGILWRDPALRFGNVSTQMFLVPNHPDRLGVWEAHAPGLPEPGGDYTFIRTTCEKMGDPIWRRDLIATLRPHLPAITIVTPWLNHPELWPDYASAVSNRTHRDQLLIVDNGSTPPALFAAVRLEENHGFAAASNIGLQQARTPAVLFLNNDVQASQPDWLEKIRRAVAPGTLVGPMLRYDDHGMVDGQRLPYLDGWCLAGMRDDLQDLGGFDEAYEEPAYYSDNDLCLRARANGLSLLECRVGLRHKVGVTSGRGENPATLAAMEANQLRFAAVARDILGVPA